MLRVDTRVNKLPSTAKNWTWIAVLTGKCTSVNAKVAPYKKKKNIFNIELFLFFLNLKQGLMFAILSAGFVFSCILMAHLHIYLPEFVFPCFCAQFVFQYSLLVLFSQVFWLILSVLLRYYLLLKMSLPVISVRFLFSFKLYFILCMVVKELFKTLLEQNIEYLALNTGIASVKISVAFKESLSMHTDTTIGVSF